MANHRLFPFWGHSPTALRTGLPQNESRRRRRTLFAALYADPARLKEFLQAMTGISRGANLGDRRASSRGRTTRPSSTSGTAQGDWPPRWRSPIRTSQGMGFDLPEVGPIFEEYVAANGVADRVKFAAGQFLRPALAEGRRRHDGPHPARLGPRRRSACWSRKAYDALPAGGAFIVYEAIIDDDRSKNAFGLLMSLNMLIETPGGFDYTGADCSGWMKEAGFRETRVEHLVGPDSMVIGVK